MPDGRAVLPLVVAACLAAAPAASGAGHQSRNSPVDLVQTSLVVPGKVKVGKKFRILDELESVGDSASGRSATYFYLSTDDVVDPEDLVVAARWVPPLGPGQTQREYTSVTVPATVVPGTYYLIARANATNAVEERYVDNNTKATKFKVEPADGK